MHHSILLHNILLLKNQFLEQRQSPKSILQGSKIKSRSLKKNKLQGALPLHQQFVSKVVSVQFFES